MIYLKGKLEVLCTLMSRGEPKLASKVKKLVATALLFLPTFASSSRAHLTHPFTCSVTFERVPHLSTDPSLCRYFSKTISTAVYTLLCDGQIYYIWLIF